MQATYISPLTDFGFKKLFGEEPNKDLLISFLNSLLPEIHQIQDLQYTKNEHQGISPLDQGSVFDLHCVGTRGDQFIVTLRKVRRGCFKDRSLYYSTFAIQRQAARDNWNYQLSPVYSIDILDFTIGESKNETVYHAQLKDQRNDLFFDKLTFTYIVLPNFTKQTYELETLQDKWLYILSNLAQLGEQPEILQEIVFGKLFAAAQFSALSTEERWAYTESLKDYRNLKNSLDTAYQTGREQGRKMTTTVQSTHG